MWWISRLSGRPRLIDPKAEPFVVRVLFHEPRRQSKIGIFADDVLTGGHDLEGVVEIHVVRVQDHGGTVGDMLDPRLSEFQNRA